MSRKLSKHPLQTILRQFHLREEIFPYLPQPVDELVIEWTLRKHTNINTNTNTKNTSSNSMADLFRNHLTTYSKFYQNPPFPKEISSERLCAQLATMGYLEVLRSGRKYGCNWNMQTPMSASIEGHFEVMKWAISHGCKYDHNAVFLNVIKYGDMGLFNWLEKRRYRFQKYKAIESPMNLNQNRNNFETYRRNMKEMAKWGRLDMMIQFSKEVKKLALVDWTHTDTEYCAISAKYGHLHVLKWLRKHGHNWDKTTILNADKEPESLPHINLLKWAIKRGCPLPSPDFVPQYKAIELAKQQNQLTSAIPTDTNNQMNTNNQIHTNNHIISNNQGIVLGAIGAQGPYESYGQITINPQFPFGVNNQTGTYNTVIGHQSGRNIKTGNNNILFGAFSDVYNSTTSGCVVLGNNAQGTTGCVVLGNHARGTEDGQLSIQIGDQHGTSFRTKFQMNQATQFTMTNSLKVQINERDYYLPLTKVPPK